MTVRELTELAGSQSSAIALLFASLPLIGALVGRLHGKGRGGGSPWRYLYSWIVYSACVPGMLSAVLTGYVLFFTRQNLLDVDPVIYFLPIISMTVTLILVSRSVSFEEIPGFDRLSGLMVVLAITFVSALALHKTRIWLVFSDSAATLAAMVVGLFLLLKWGTNRLFGTKYDPRTKPPTLRLP
ncbi:MAG: hypothetical protein V2B18_03660 [Pseudomonadota bacterium]